MDTAYAYNIVEYPIMMKAKILLSGFGGFRSSSASFILSKKKSAGLSNASHSRPNVK